jgi:hypothetical protein
MACRGLVTPDGVPIPFDLAIANGERLEGLAESAKWTDDNAAEYCNLRPTADVRSWQAPNDHGGEK